MSREIPLSKIDYGRNVRVEADNDIKELARSIDEHDVLNPLLVRPTKNGRFEVICGHRRYRALQLVANGGDIFVPCEVRADIEEKDLLKVQLEENIQRKQMSAFELMEAIEQIKAQSEKKLTAADIGKMLNKSQQWVAGLQYAVRHAEETYGKSGLKKAKREKYTMGKIIGDMQKKRAEETKFEGSGFSGSLLGNTIKIKCERKADADVLLSYIKNYLEGGMGENLPRRRIVLAGDCMTKEELKDILKEKSAAYIETLEKEGGNEMDESLKNLVAKVYSQGFLDGINSALGVAQLALLKKEAENGK